MSEAVNVELDLKDAVDFLLAEDFMLAADFTDVAATDGATLETLETVGVALTLLLAVAELAVLKKELLRGIRRLCLSFLYRAIRSSAIWVVGLLLIFL